VIVEARNVVVIARKEIRDAARNRWLVFFGAGFALLSTALAWLGASTFSAAGLAGFARTGLSLVNLALLLVPLVGLTLGALAIAAERERGTLLCLLAQPVVAGEILAGKFLGLALVLGATLGCGFGVGALVISWKTGVEQIGAYVAVIGFTWMLALATLSLGLVISALARTSAAAVGVALLAWLGLVFFGDLGLMATSVTFRIGAGPLLALALLNPLQVFKTAAVVAIDGGGEALGAAGMFAAERYGAALLPLLAAALLAWTTLPLGLAWMLLRKRSAV
jgi:Cu-processing system permease protein